MRGCFQNIQRISRLPIKRMACLPEGVGNVLFLPANRQRIVEMGGAVGRHLITRLMSAATANGRCFRGRLAVQPFVGPAADTDAEKSGGPAGQAAAE
jgi:hypothetical protein